LLTEEVKDVETATRMLDRVKRQKGDVSLHGETWLAENEEPLAGARVRIRGVTNLNLTSDKDGRFEAKLAPGHYRIVAFSPDGRLMLQSIYNLESIDAANFTTESGECIDLRFIRAR
jgi:hypothetical protein